MVEVQHDHILVKIDIDAFLQLANDFLTSDSAGNNLLTSFIDDIKKKAQISQITLLINNFKQHLKYLS